MPEILELPKARCNHCTTLFNFHPREEFKETEINDTTRENDYGEEYVIGTWKTEKTYVICPGCNGKVMVELWQEGNCWHAPSHQNFRIVDKN